MRKIYYWKFILCTDDNSFPKGFLEKLASGSNLAVKKLQGHEIYSTRLNKRDRLLFAKILLNGDPCLLLLEFILNHDYQKSRFLKPGVLNYYLETNSKAFGENVIYSDHFEKTNPEKVGCFRSEGEKLHYTPIQFYNKKHIEFNDTQQNILSSPLPLVVSGPPGSGKSCVALALLGKAVLQTTHSAYFLYVSTSKALINTMQELWKQRPEAHNHYSQVIFRTYQELLLEHSPDCANKEIVGEPDFNKWLTLYIKKYEMQVKIKNTDNKGPSFQNYNHIYQEFRIISGYENFDYLNLGQKQSLFKIPYEKQWLLGAYQSYLAYLQSNNKINPAFHSIVPRFTYDMIIVDETQDLSRLQVKALGKVTKNFEICYFLDSHQSLYDSVSIRPYLLGAIESIHHIKLPFSYRCPENIKELANKVLNLKFLFTKGLGDKDEPKKIDASNKADGQEKNNGHLIWIDSMSEHQTKILRTFAKSPNFAVITLEEYKETISKKLNTPLVFTAKEVKGLEYEIVLALSLFDKPIFKKANSKMTLMTPEKIGQAQTNHRAKKNTGEIDYSPSFNEIFTSLTRTLKTLIIYQKKDHSIQHIIDFLLSAASFEKDIPEKPTQSMEQQGENNLTPRWLDEAEKQIELGNISQAKNIFINILDKTEKDFKDLLDAKTKRNAQASEEFTTNSSHLSPFENILPLMTNSEAPKILSNFLLNNPNLIPQITGKDLCGPQVKETSSEKGASPLYWLTANEEGQKMLSSLLLQNRNLTQQITGEALCHPRAKESGAEENASPLYWLTTNTKGLQILSHLLLNNRNLAQQITKKALCRPRTKEAGAEENASPLYWLTTSAEGLEILSHLLLNNRNLAQRITKKALCRSRTQEAEAEKNTSPLYWLIANKKGQKILSSLLRQNLKLNEELTASLAPSLAAPQTIISTNQALDLIKKYEASLIQLQQLIQASKNNLNHDHQMVTNVKNALNAIAYKTSFTPKLMSLEMGNKQISTDPQEAINCLLIKHYFKEYFKKICSLYAKNVPQLLEKLKSFHEEFLRKKLIFYKAAEGELAIKFPTVEHRNQFIKKMGGIATFPPNDKFNPNVKCPMVYENNNTTLFIPAYQAYEGELAIVLPERSMREPFLKLISHGEGDLYCTYEDQDAIYFNSELHTQGRNLSINSPDEILKIKNNINSYHIKEPRALINQLSIYKALGVPTFFLKVSSALNPHQNLHQSPKSTTIS